MRKLIVAVLVLLVLAAAADFAAARVAEDRVAGELQREYDLSRRPVVQIRDFPFLPHLFTGRFDTVDLAATDVRARGVAARQVEVHLHDVHVDRAVLLGERGRVTVGRADGQVELGQAELSRLLADRLQGASLEIGEDGVRLRVSTDLAGQTVAAVVTGQLGASAGQVTFRPQRVQVEGLADGLERQLAQAFTFTVPLPELPAGVRIERVVTRPGAVVLAGRAAAVQVST
jgi:LmeA-like phospholipid-binding